MTSIATVSPVSTTAIGLVALVAETFVLLTLALGFLAGTVPSDVARLTNLHRLYLGEHELSGM